MKPKDLNRGFDSPKKLKEQDRLDRWKFAENIYSIVKNTPNDWSNRIGIYGGWGEGKTSVLEFINTIASEEKQIVVWFNPWQFTTPEELWESFVITMFETLQNYGVDVKSELIKIKGKKITRTVLDKSMSLSKIIPYAEAGLPIIKNFLNVNKKVLSKLPKKISDKKIIILIDDLDRANIDLIPQLLFAVKELLDLPGLTFILAFDPEIVNESLKTNDYNITRGKDFLDKIIDFPEWLPEPDENTYREYLKYELSESIDFVDTDSVFQIFNYLQKNPRKLKQFVRGLIILKDEISRYLKEDINWTLLLLILLLKTYYPKISNLILTNNELWDRFDTENWLGKGSNPDRPDRSEEQLKDLISSLEITDKMDEKKLTSIIKHIAGIVKAGLSETIKYHLDIIQGRSILTWKEYGNFLAQFEKKQTKDCVEKEIRKYGANNNEVFKELFVKTLHNREWLLNQASDSNLESERKRYTDNAKLALVIIKIICLEMGGLSGPHPFLTTEDFSEIYKQISRWLHFTMPKHYNDLRIKEKEFLVELCNDTTIDLKSLLNFLKPWFPYRTGAYDSPAEKKLSEDLGIILEERIAKSLIHKFLDQGWVYSIFDAEANFVEQYIMLRKDSFFWSEELKKKFFNYSENDEKKDIITLNAIHLISIIDYTFFDPMGHRSVFNEKNAIIYDQEIMLKIWELATQQVINPRMFKSIENFRDKVKEKLNLEFPKPSWWDEIKKMVEERSKEK